MSHTTEIKDIVFTDIIALRQAVAELVAAGVVCELKENSKARAYFAAQQGMTDPFPYVLHLSNSRYDVGFAYDAALKGHVPRCDLWGGDIARQIGVTASENASVEQAALGKLRQVYAVCAATRKAVQQGYSVTRSVKQDGTISLIVSGYQ